MACGTQTGVFQAMRIHGVGEGLLAAIVVYGVEGLVKPPVILRRFGCTLGVPQAIALAAQCRQCGAVTAPQLCAHFRPWWESAPVLENED